MSAQVLATYGMIGTNQAFDGLAAALAAAGSPIGLAQMHGVVCGVFCAGGREMAHLWLDRCLGECEFAADDDQFAAQFHALRIETGEALAGGDMEFAPLLPDDDTALPQRVHALASWCHGFVTGLGLGGLQLDDADPADRKELAEIVRDFVDISKADIAAETTADSNAPEFWFAEVTEFVRVGVQFVFEEIGRSAQARDPRSLN